MTDYSWRTDLAKWMDKVREAYLSAARKRGYRSRVQREKLSVLMKGHGSYQLRRETVSVNVLSLDPMTHYTFDSKDLRLPQFPAEVAGAFLDQFGTTCKYWTPFTRDDARQLLSNPELSYEDRPEDWLIASVFFPIADHYARHTQHADKPDIALAEALIEDAVNFCANELFRVELQFPISGLPLNNEAKIDGISVSVMQPDQIGEFLKANGYSNPPSTYSLSWSDRFIPTHMLSVEAEAHKDTQPFAWFTPDTVLLAFQLHGFQIGSPGGCIVLQKPSWTEFGRSSHFTISTRSHEIGRAIGTSDLIQIKKTIEDIDGPPRHIAPADLASQRDAHHMSIRQFQRAIERRLAIDGVVDCVIGLEAIFLAGGDKGELKYRFRTNGANWLAQDRIKRHEIYKQLGDLYDLRSAIVHGSLKQKQEKSIVEHNKLAKELLADAIKKGLAQGWPTPEDFLNLALG